jgi:hypothetical protein
MIRNYHGPGQQTGKVASLVWETSFPLLLQNSQISESIAFKH